MLRALLIFGLPAVALVLALEFLPISVLIWDGHFDLTVNVSSTAGPLRSVSCQACGDRDLAEHVLKSRRPFESDLWAVIADPFEGEPLTVKVPVSGRTSPFGREVSRYQFSHLVVIGHLQDGRRLGKLVEIPDGRVSRTVSVSLP